MSQEGKNDNEKLADELFVLQKDENKGRGINCVRDVVVYWRRGDLESARQIAWHDDDKIREYPHIQQWLEDNLFGPDVDSPLKLAKRIEGWGKPENS